MNYLVGIRYSVEQTATAHCEWGERFAQQALTAFPGLQHRKALPLRVPLKLTDVTEDLRALAASAASNNTASNDPISDAKQLATTAQKSPTGVATGSGGELNAGMLPPPSPSLAADDGERGTEWGTRPWYVDMDAKRRLTIGYISPDFFTHSVSYFIECLLAHHDRDVFRVICYSNVKGDGDTKTKRFQQMVGPENWRRVDRLESAACAQLVQDDGVDLLIDLAGHTANNRLDVLVLRAAPLQLSWLGYPNTTGESPHKAACHSACVRCSLL
jgi:hypothetical protein